MHVVAIIPAYNEEKRITQAIADALDFVDDVIVVDDCSADRTSAVSSRMGAYVLRHRINRGQGAALQTGTDYALDVLNADIVVHFDADGQMRGEDIPVLLEPLATGEADIVLGSRFLGQTENMPFTRRVTLWFALIVTRILSGIRLTDTHNGFRAMTARTAKEMRITMDRMAHASQILDFIPMHHFRYVERPVTITYTDETLEKGQSFSGAFIILKDFFKGKFLDS